MDYIWFNYEKPILEQLPYPFTEAAILLNPFIQMPIGWTDAKKKSEYAHVYPKLEESLQLGRPKSWKEVLNDTRIQSYEELAVALKTSILAFKKEFARPDLANQLNNNLSQDLYYPREDNISEFLVSDILDVLCSNGADTLLYSAPIFDQTGELPIKNITQVEVCRELPLKEIIITNKQRDYAFLSVFDSFITIFLTKEKKIEEFVNKKKWEAVICGPETYISWYFGKID
ncbi:DUF2711 family protein [Paenibacillus anseongense]|uniref:DUF2711 family protein n=1 Tax=Paenibacillus anseongense TaxID=2682845 RepID=UPI002DB90168|nr:DUF2711 family protein [Paenibacillus anseongense]MEC0269040.1 DUF2711 family protein [Paenibacillus anseongense]